MKILVDTCVWSAVLRHKDPDIKITERLKDFITDGLVTIIGPIRQELLSGISSIQLFNSLNEYMSPFEDINLKTIHFVKAAEFSNTCRKQGIQGSTIDYLICSVAHLENLIIYTTDKDFRNYKKFLPIKILK